MPADQGLIDTASNLGATVMSDNLKVVAGGPSAYLSSLFQAHAAHLARLNMIAEDSLANGLMVSRAAASAAVKSLTELDAVEAMANAVVGQQGAKVAQSTPPETAKPA